MSNLLSFVSGLAALALVSAQDGDNHTTSWDSKTAQKRGVADLTGVPGLLFSQFLPQMHTVPVPQPFPVPVPQPVPVQVPRPFPVTVHKPVGLPVPVGIPVPVNVPVPKPYPVPVPVNIPPLRYSLIPSLSAYGGSPYGGFPLGASSPFTDHHSADFAHAAPQSVLGVPGAASSAGKLSYGLGVYSSGTPSLALAHPGMTAALYSPFPGHTGLLSDLLTGYPPKY